MKSRPLFLSILGVAAFLATLPAFAQQTAADFYNAAGAAMKKADFDTAIADFTQAIALDPGVQDHALSRRGFAKLHKNDLSGALADFNRTITLNPKSPASYFGRALVEQANGALDAAIADYHQVITLGPPGGDNPHFYLWVVSVQQNHKVDADRELLDYMPKRAAATLHDWHSKIGEYLLGQITESELTTDAISFSDLASQDRARCEALYFVGMKCLIAGNKAAAADDFRKCLATNQTMLTQYPLAEAESEAIELDPPR